MKLTPKTIALASAGAVAFTVAAVSHVIYHHKPRPKVRTITDGEGTPIRVLQVGNTYQSATYVEEDKRSEPVLEYVKTFDVMFDFGIPIDSILMLGAGGCVYPHHVMAKHPEVRFDAVEGSQAIATLAKDHFFTEELSKNDQFKLHIADALDFLTGAKEDGTTYSAIINDCFEGKKADKTLRDASALKLVRDCLQEDGLYLVNVSTPKNPVGKKALKSTTKALNKAFNHVYTFPCTDEEFGKENNYILVATDCDYKLG